MAHTKIKSVFSKKTTKNIYGPLYNQIVMLWDILSKLLLISKGYLSQT